MLTYFRKIRRSLLVSSQFRRYILYALGEITLVVIGILIALQINNWNEWRKDRKVEQVVLEDIRDNIIRNNQLIETALEKFHQINQSTKIVKNAIKRKSPYSDSLKVHFYQSIKHGGFLLRLNSDGYESLRNIGFSIIQNEELKDQILSLFEVSYSNYEIELQWGNSVYSGGYGWWKEYFYMLEGELFVPIDYNRILTAENLLSDLDELAEVRATIQNEIEACYAHNQAVLQLIIDELGED